MTRDSQKPYILGISAGDHDASAALFEGTRLVAALEEEKVARIRRARGFPTNAIQFCLEEAGIRPEQIEVIALARPLRGEPRGLQRGESWMPQWLKGEFPASKIVVLDHHLCHAAAAYFCSPFDESAILTLDENGDLKTAGLSLARGTEIDSVADAYFPDSLGNLYSRITALLGFARGGDEHKVQWLSAYGSPAYAPVLCRVLQRGAKSLLRMDQSYFRAGHDEKGGFGEKFFQETGLSPTEPLQEQAVADLAASIQHVLEEIVLDLCKEFLSQHPCENLCLAGGVGLNALLVERLESSKLFQRVFVQPASGNAGNALGAALYCAHSVLKISDRHCLDHLFYGPEFSDADVKDVLENCKLRFRYILKRGEMVAAAVDELRQDHIVGWFQGRAEFGPRALGARSILASPLGTYVNENLNQYVKHRERFRPFAASVIAERADEFFEFGESARFLASIGKVKPEHRATFAANLLPDRNGESSGGEPNRIRVHVVERQTNPFFWELLDNFGKATGLPVLFNTSFNLFGEPLVCSPRDAIRSFYCSGLDHLVIGNFSITK